MLETPDRLSEVGARVFSSLQEDEGFRVIFDNEGVVLLKKETPAAPAALRPEGVTPGSIAGVPAHN